MPWHVQDKDVARVDLKMPVELKVLCRDKAFMAKAKNVQTYILRLVAADCGRPELAQAYEDYVERKLKNRGQKNGR